MSYSFSVIVSTFNSELWLHKVLIGFNNQTYKDFELIVADDGSNHKIWIVNNKDQIEKILQDEGYEVARRTVAKYREQLNIPVARLRREY